MWLFTPMTQLATWSFERCLLCSRYCSTRLTTWFRVRSQVTSANRHCLHKRHSHWQPKRNNAGEPELYHGNGTWIQCQWLALEETFTFNDSCVFSRHKRYLRNHSDWQCQQRHHNSTARIQYNTAWSRVSNITNRTDINDSNTDCPHIYAMKEPNILQPKPCSQPKKAPNSLPSYFFCFHLLGSRAPSWLD